MTEQTIPAAKVKPIQLGAPTTHSCGASWTGTRTAHCGGCCLTFSSLTAFDAHQRGGRPGQICRKPDEVGLVPVEKSHGTVWSWPGNGHNPHAKASEQ